MTLAGIPIVDRDPRFLFAKPAPLSCLASPKDFLW